MYTVYATVGRTSEDIRATVSAYDEHPPEDRTLIHAVTRIPDEAAAEQLRDRYNSAPDPFARVRCLANSATRVSPEPHYPGAPVVWQYESFEDRKGALVSELNGLVEHCIEWGDDGTIEETVRRWLDGDLRLSAEFK